ncbi:MAG: hypothetical protein AAF514_20850, partial [Verrucomicrobiota bacterium]
MLALSLLGGLFVAALPAEAGLNEENVALVYFSPAGESSDGLRLWQKFQAAYPGAIGINLADGLPTDTRLDSGNISYDDFILKIRTPIRNHLQTFGLEKQIHALVLTRGLPHRILHQQPGYENIGDSPSAAREALVEGTASYSSVDSELTLLWEDLETVSGSGEGMSRHFDNFILNPYFKVDQSITRFERNGEPSSPIFHEMNEGSVRFWKMSLHDDPCEPGVQPDSILLVSRLDGPDQKSALAMIDRARNLNYDVFRDLIVLDGSEREFD